MRASILFTFLICLSLASNLNAQDVSQFDIAINEIQKKMQTIDPNLTSNNHADNPLPEAIVSKPELLDLITQKGELLWQKYKTKNGMKTLIANFKTFKSGVRGLEQLAINGDSKLREVIAAKTTTIFEGCIRGTLEGYNMTKGEPMFEEAIMLMEQYDRLNDYLANPGTVEILTKENLPKLPTYIEYLRENKKAMVEYFVGHKMIFATIVWPGGLDQLQVANKQKVLTNIKKLQASMSALPAEDMLAQNYTDFTTSSLLLSQLLFNHPMNTLPDSINSVVVIPDGAIKAIPFDLLLRTASKNTSNSFALEDQDYVMEKYQLSYAKSSMTMMQEKSKTSEETNKKLDLLKDPSKAHPSQWKSLLPSLGEGVVINSITNSNEKDEGGSNKMIFFALGILAVLLGLFFARKKTSKA